MKINVRTVRRSLHTGAPFLLLFLLLIPNAYSFCGFFVAKADTKLFNETSQVIIVRDGQQSTITMSNDFKGDVKDFAMVVPVPVVLMRHEIRISNQNIFDQLDAYSAPRLAEYYDSNPCMLAMTDSISFDKDAKEMNMEYFAAPVREESTNGVTIEARYSVGEYDILILSAKESDGLKTWLDKNEYKIPHGAEEVLDPYIKSGMKFFVAKVNLKRQSSYGYTTLNPLQISFQSDKFMLPIRLGMANAKGDQDMVVYAFTKKGRVETTNYRTVKLPSNNEIPLFVQSTFGNFYKDLFATAYRRNEGKTVFLEYAWDLDGTNGMKCDPCVSPPPLMAEMAQAGVSWLYDAPNNPGNYGGAIFFTRLHVRYNRQNFPQDLMFQETPNRERYQCRYVIHHPATGDLSCDAGQEYLKTLVDRRQKELHALAKLTDWNIMKYQDYISKYSKEIRGEPMPFLDTGDNGVDTDANGTSKSSVMEWPTSGIFLLLVAGFAILRWRVNHTRSNI